MQPAGSRPHAQMALTNLYPGYFAFVMATGIVSTAADLFQLQFFSLLLLLLATVGYGVLIVLYVWRLIAFPQETREDAINPGKAFGFFTFVAASNVLAVRYVTAGDLRIAVLLGGIGAIAWLALTYTIPLGLMLGSSDHRLGPSVNGSWLIWVVATQSVSTVASVFASTGGSQAALLAFLAATYWAIGTILYLVLITIITGRLLLSGMSAAELTPPYWINMGATAISVLAGARLLAVPLPAELAALQPVVLGISFMLWAFGSFWIPAVVLFGVWRYGAAGQPLAYEPALWSMVFPLGMYGTATDLFGKTAGLPWLPQIAWGEVWFAYAAWVIVFLGMITAAWRRKALGGRPSGIG
ncbi:MAG: tellurite resistance/C4-dicarboxylate transporter family protein [Thermaerobacter sp.]|nr:tellurite resistance/C4-dicarboxylate transporter family protein [Thermaerobacter sp.]